MDSIQSPMASTIQVSVYAEPGVAIMPLHCPIILTGINPSNTIFINRPPSSRMSTLQVATMNTNFIVYFW